MTSSATLKSSRGRVRLGLLGSSILALFALSSSAPAAPAATQVDLKLVLATDVSGSINDEEAELQRLGTADAFTDPDVIKSIQNGALGRIAVTMLDFSSPEYDKVIIDWHIIKDKASATAFADMVRAAPRSPGRRTSVSSALELGSTLIESSAGDIVATRRVIDVSGDGPNNDGNPMREVHDRVIGQGIIVNGLPVMDDNANGYYPGLDKYYAACVAGGRGSFVVVVHSFKDLGAAMRHKLILEVSGIDPATKFADKAPAKKSLLTKIAAQEGPAAQPQVLRPGQNEFSDHCDIAGGFGGFNRF
ncbi:MAG TPA: DUF1194 domain-containing protein [Micropepsaceae bacterium]|nr:DUF1194 domain-containing protein [Micropepsaceae bacterium]